MVYNYTKPRGPIAAMSSGPGPSYGLPGMVGQAQHDPRSVHYKNPAYSFGIKHGRLTDDCSPGPTYLPSPKVIRTGMDGTPHYSLYSRPRDVRPFSNPGPGAYSPQHVGPQAHFRHPAYSFGSRNRSRRSDDIPAANAYSLDTMIGRTVRSGKNQAPIFTMRPRYTTGAFYEDMAKTPGPGTYITTVPDIYKGRAPLFSMTGRNTVPGDNAQKPGPGAHRPEQVLINKRSAPSHSFGIRHSSYLAPLIVDPV